LFFGGFFLLIPESHKLGSNYTNKGRNCKKKPPLFSPVKANGG